MNAEIPRRARRGRVLLYVGMAFWAVAFIAFYPRVFAIVDEDAYLTHAYLFRTGHLTYERSSIPAPHMTVETDGRLASKYPPGMGFLLLPFTFAGWRVTFAVGLLMALAGTALLALILRRVAPEADPAWALLWLYYPAVTLYSRTLMSDLPAAVLVLAAFHALVRGRRFAAGLAVGAAVLIRYSNGMLAVVFVAVIMAVGAMESIGPNARGPKGQKRDSYGVRLRRAVTFGFGLLPGILLALGYNWYCYGGPFSFPMYLTGEFAPGFFLRNMVYYGRGLLLAYPLMLIAPLLVLRRWRVAIAVPAYAVLAFYSFFSYIHESPGLAEQVTAGLRYLLPGIGFFILALALLLGQVEVRLRGGRGLKYALLGLALVVSIAVHWHHDRYLAIHNQYRRLVYDTVPDTALVIANAQATKLFSHAWGDRDYLRFVEFNVAVPVDSAIVEATDPWALLLQRPGRVNTVERELFRELLVRYPDRELVAEAEAPWYFQAWRLKEPKADVTDTGLPVNRRP